MVLSGTGTHLVSLNYCLSCYIYKPPGCSNPGTRSRGAHHPTIHCHQCDSCIEQFDHHCPFLSNCIGRNNYTKFFALLHVSLASILFQISILYRDFFSATGSGATSDKQNELESLSTIDEDALYTFHSHYQLTLRYAIAPILCLLFLPIALLTLFHWIRVVTQGSTTYEVIKKSLQGYLVDPRNPL